MGSRIWGLGFRIQGLGYREESFEGLIWYPRSDLFLLRTSLLRAVGFLHGLQLYHVMPCSAWRICSRAFRVFARKIQKQP